jgi:hypothetical protein
MQKINRRESDMTFTLKKNVNMDSLVVQHGILLQATDLLVGREGVLETEKELYLILAVTNAMIEEDLIQMCNEDGRDLVEIMEYDIEPFFHKVLGQELSIDTYNKIKKLLLDRCREIWDNQHSVIGLIDAILTAIATMSDEDKKEALVETSKIAEKVLEKRTEVMTDKVDQVDSKLEALIAQYQRMPQPKENDTNE